MRILVLTQYFAPEPCGKIADLVQRLRQQGHDVEVLTSFPCYPQGKIYNGWRQSFFRREMLDGVPVLRVPQFPDHSQSALKRICYYVSFALSAMLIGMWRVRRADVMYVYQSALPVGVAAWWISRCRRIPYLLDVVDLWPESVLASGMIRNRWLISAIRLASCVVYRAADRVSVITQGYWHRLRAMGVSQHKLAVVLHWQPAELEGTALVDDSVDGDFPDDRFHVVYAGNIGKCQALDVVVDCALVLRETDPQVRFSLVGDGTEVERLRARCQELQIANVAFLGREPAEAMPRIYQRAGALLVHLERSDLSEISIPSKTISYLASGRPILLGVAGEATRFFGENNCGVAFEPGSADALAQAVRKLVSAPPAIRTSLEKSALATYAGHFHPETQVSRMLEQLRIVATKRPLADASVAIPRRSFYQRRGKRMLDMAIAATALVALAPVYCVIALLAAMRLGLPVFFRQKRAGFRGQPFEMVKFRSMKELRDERGELLPDDERLTRFGSILRVSSLDELPELWNVLRGEMSLVGPRPLLMRYLERYTPEQNRRHEVKPGLTGWAQVNGRNALSWEQRLRLDVWYVDHQSFWLDVSILWKTLFKVVTRQGICAAGCATMSEFMGNLREESGDPVMSLSSESLDRGWLGKEATTMYPPSLASARLAIEGGSPVRTTPFPKWPVFDEEMIQAVGDTLRSGKVNYWTGDAGRQFEQEYASLLGVKHAIALANGTNALELALHALGIGEGDEVVVTCRTFLASASCIVSRGAVPVFADVDPISQNITAESVGKVLSRRTKAIIAVHLAGWPCEMDQLMELARDHDLQVIEDCAQAHGAMYRGRPLGTFGDLAAFSFCQDKIITTGGEGGLLTTNNDDLWRRAWAFKDHGKSWDAVYNSRHPQPFRWLHESFGTNWRLTEMQATLGRIALRRLPVWLETRRRHAAIWTTALAEFDSLRLTYPPDHVRHSYYKYYAFLEPACLRPGWTRDLILRAIEAEGIPCGSGSCSEIYLEKAFDNHPSRPVDRLPVARQLGETSLMFFVDPALSDDDLLQMTQGVAKVLRQATNGMNAIRVDEAHSLSQPQRPRNRMLAWHDRSVSSDVESIRTS